MFITKKHLSRRTVLRGLGATVALPFLDAMVPAATAPAEDRGRPEDRGWPHRDGARRRRLARSRGWPSTTGRRSRKAPTSSSRRACLRSSRSATTSRSSATPIWPTPSRPPRRSRRRPQSLVRGVPDREPSQAHRRVRHLRRRVDGSDLRAEVRAGHARCRRSSCASRTSGRSPAPAATATAASTRRRSPGRRRRCRSRWSAIRGSRSSACSATARRLPSGPRGAGRTSASSTPSGRGSACSRGSSGPAIARRLNEYLDGVGEIERRLQNVEKQNISGEARSCPTRRSACPIPSKSTPS